MRVLRGPVFTKYGAEPGNSARFAIFFHVLTHFCSKKNVFSGADRTPTTAPGHIAAGNYRQNPRGTAPPPHTPTRTQSALRAGAAQPAAGAPGEGHRGGGRRGAPGGGLQNAVVLLGRGSDSPLPTAASSQPSSRRGLRRGERGCRVPCPALPRFARPAPRRRGTGPPLGACALQGRQIWREGECPKALCLMASLFTEFTL